MWEDFIKKEEKEEYFINLMKFLENERLTKNVYPNKDLVFRAFKLTPLNKVKVVILGQDPYYLKDMADGLSFSTKLNKTPKSLLNIKKELSSDLGIEVSNSNDLTNWAKAGVLLLNTSLTVLENKPLSHSNKGWEIFTLKMFLEVTKLERPVVFILWGNNARKYKKYITNNSHLVIESSHPSPLSAYHSFFNSKPFSKTNNYLIKHNLSPIDFSL